MLHIKVCPFQIHQLLVNGPNISWKLLQQAAFLNTTHIYFLRIHPQLSSLQQQKKQKNMSIPKRDCLQIALFT